jgi:type IV pilus assembly protein PilC
MMIYVVPTLTQTIKSLGVELPLTTQIIIWISDFMVAYLVFVLTGFAVLVVSVWRLLKTEKGKELFDRVVIKVPLFGPLVKKFNTARFTRTLSYLITAGVPIVRSLEITSKVLGHTLYRRVSQEAAKDVQKGKQLNEILGRHTEIFQPVVIQMIKVGEETGKVSDLMLRVAIFFEEDVTETTKNLSTVIEPILMIVIGTAVGFFAVSMLQPIYGSLGNI